MGRNARTRPRRPQDGGGAPFFDASKVRPSAAIDARARERARERAGNIRARRGARARAREGEDARTRGRRAIDRGRRSIADGARATIGRRDAAPRRARREARVETIGRITRAMDRAARDAREGRGRRGGGKADDRDPMAARWREVWARDEAGREEAGLTTRARLETVEINAQCLKARNIFPS